MKVLLAKKIQFEEEILKMDVLGLNWIFQNFIEFIEGLIVRKK